MPGGRHMSIFLLLLSILLNLALLYLVLQLHLRSKEPAAIPDGTSLIQIQEALGKLEQRWKEESYLNRTELGDRMEHSFYTFKEAIRASIQDTSGYQKERFDTFAIQLDKLSVLVEEKLKQLQESNEQKLEQMRLTVDEKLATTLENRLGKSFAQVSQQLEQVYKGLGEMKQLASGVDDLKKVLSNVKSRGVLGEIQLENILEQMFTKEQYIKNAVIKKNSRERVEFAIKIPSKEREEASVLLPIDAKFPLADYERFQKAQEEGNLKEVAEALKQLEKNIKEEAKKIQQKYIDPPLTTDFAILFLPLEGLYAEVLRRPGLWDQIQRKYKVIITGPSTLSAFLNSLHMGFRTLAIQKQTLEVWELLTEVETGFHRFGETLIKAQKRLDSASNAIGEATKQTETIRKKLGQVQKLPSPEKVRILS